MLRSLRLGFATNSSSAHSIVLHSDPRFLDMLNGDTLMGAAGIGRDNFTFVDRRAKLGYLLWLHEKQANFDSAHATLELIASIPDLVEDDIDSLRQEIQHFETESYASSLLCPKNVKIGTWFAFLLNSPVAFHGYDDNNGQDFAEVTAKDVKAIELDRMTYKQDGEALIGFCSETGLKFRWSPNAYDKATVPELVDLKITDYCGWGCKFCYQGSTKEGKHAPLAQLKETIEALANEGVFEIAIGGGEPVEHPDFGTLITFAHKKNITLNFTTYGIDWATPENDVVKAMKAVWWRGGIGVSVHSMRDVDKVKTLQTRLQEDCKVYGASVMAQTVIGATPMDATQKIVESCIENDIPVLLLGYKTTGRGKSFAARKVDLEHLKRIVTLAKNAVAREPVTDDYGYVQTRNFTLSVDTAFLDAYGDVLDALDVPYILRTSPEGKFSMYIDAVTNTAAPSSYCDPSLGQSWDPKNLKAIFKAF